MATLQQALTRIDAICPNAWDETAKLLWLNECESMIQTRILGAAPEQCITYDADTDRSTKLLVPAPFDRLYVYYVIAMCDYAAHETAHYADSMMLFNAALDEYAKWYQRTNGAAASTPGLVKEIAANTKARHTHANKTVLDSITEGKVDIWDAKASRATATAGADGLMSAADKRKLDTVEAGAAKTIIDDAMSGTSANPVQNKVIKAYVDGKAPDDYVVNITFDNASTPAVIDDSDLAVFHASADKTFAEISSAVAEGKNVYGMWNGHKWPLYLSNPATGYAFRGSSHLDKVFGNVGLAVANCVIGQNGCTVTASAGELPAPALDGADDGKSLVVNGHKWAIKKAAGSVTVDAALDAASENPVQNKAVKTALDGKAGTAVATTSANGLMSAADKAKLDGIEAGANKTTVDTALDASSTNPVQNKAVKAALDKKLSTSGNGSISGGLTLDGGISVGHTKTYTGVHLYKDSEGVAKLTSGSAGVDDTVPLARLKVASPTEDDDAATKAYVDGKAAGSGAVRYDAAQELTGAQKIQARANIGAASTDGAQLKGYVTLSPFSESLYDVGVGLSPKRSGNQWELDISDVNEVEPTLLTGVKTPTDANTNAAATVEYVKNKIAEAAAGGGVDVDTALDATSTNPVQNKAVKAALDSKLNQTSPTIKGGEFFLDGSYTQLQLQCTGGVQSATGEEYANLDITDVLLQITNDQIVISGLADFGDAEAVGMENTAVSYAQLLGYTKPLTLTYANGQVTGAAYTDIRKAIERGRQIKLSVANTPDIIASNARNETNKSVLKFISTDVGGDTVNITQYTVTAQASGLTGNVKTHELA